MRSAISNNPSPSGVALRLIAGCLMAVWSLAAGASVHVLAAENFYGDMASQLAGPDVGVSSVLHNPSDDPHLFEPDIATARAVADADLVIYNGLSYDTWMSKLLGNAGTHARLVIEVAAVVGVQPGANPHIWYQPRLLPLLARAISQRLQQLDPTHAQDYGARLTQYLLSLQPLDDAVAQTRMQYAGVNVAATEPVAQYLLDAVGLHDSNEAFQLAVMNDTEPSASDTAQFEQTLATHAVRVLIFNPQVDSSAVSRLLSRARAAQVPMVGMTELEPVGMHFQSWMLSQLRSLQQALAQQALAQQALAGVAR